MNRAWCLLFLVLLGLAACKLAGAEKTVAWWQAQPVQQQLDQLREDLAYEVQRATNAEWCLQTVVALNEGEYEGEQLSGEVEYAREYCQRVHLWPSRK